MVNTGNTSGRVYWGKEGILSNNVFKITFCDLVDSTYLYYVLTSQKVYDKLKTHFKQGAQPHLGHRTIAEQQIVLPDLMTQKQIVLKIQVEEKINRNS